MEWPIILAVVIGVVIILFPLLFVWYLNVSGIYTVVRETQRRRAARKKRLRELRVAEETVVRETVRNE